MTDTLKLVEETLGGGDLRKKPRAVLLLKLYQLSQVLLPELSWHYWERLQPIGKYLPAEYKEEYKELRAALDPDNYKNKGFVSNIIAEINTACEKAAASPKDAIELFQKCEQRLKKRWWSFGKSPAWIALIKAWGQVDRKAAIRLIGKMPKSARKNLLVQWNKNNPLSPEEWEMVCQHSGFFGNIESLVEEMLDQTDSKMCLPSKLAKKVANRLRNEITAVGEDVTDSKRKKALEKYERLVEHIAQDESNLAKSLMRELFSTITKTGHLFGEEFPKGFSFLCRIVSGWVSLDKTNEAAVKFILEKTPKFLRDFALAQWYGMVPETMEEVKVVYKELLSKVSSTFNVEVWFLVTLVRRGMGIEAITVANSSENKKDLLPRLRRAWICEHPETARRILRAEDFQDDLIGQFLMMPSVEERFNFLRDRTQKGSISLPTELWTKLDVLDVLSCKSLVVRIYWRNTKKEEQFDAYLRLHGYDYYDYKDVDPYLLTTLLYWDDKHPQEVASLLTHMWEVMKPSDSDLIHDIVRNVIFERCRTLFAAHPRSLIDFIEWFKRKLVDQSLRYPIMGQPVYTLSFKETTPFLFCLLAAEQVARFSSKRCDEILIHAVNSYKADEEMIAAAASLYASHKGLKAINAPVMPQDGELADAWQIAIVKTSLPIIADAMLERHGV